MVAVPSDLLWQTGLTADLVDLDELVLGRVSLGPRDPRVAVQKGAGGASPVAPRNPSSPSQLGRSNQAQNFCPSAVGGPSASSHSWGPSASSPSEGERQMLRAVCHLLKYQTARGGKIRSLSARSLSCRTWHEVLAHLFNWSTIVSVPWREADAHINVREARARQFSVR